MALTRRELTLARSAADVVWWLEGTGSDLDGLLSGDREALDELRKALAPYVRDLVIRPLAERRQPEPEPRWYS